MIGEAAEGAIRIALPPLVAVREAALGRGRAEADQAVRDALAETAAAVPASPAVYVLRDSAGTPLTVSHTADLRARLLKADAPVVAAAALEYAPCVSAFDAALRHLGWLRALEPDRYGPWLPYPTPYFLRLDLGARFPRFEPTDVPDFAPGVRLFGPYPTRAALEQAETALYAALPLRRCTWDVQGHDVDESCIYLQMRRCAAPCTGDVPPDAYRRLVDAGADLLEGRPERAAADLTARRDAAAGTLAFEEAARLQAALDRLGRETPPPAFDLARWTVAVLSGVRKGEGGARTVAVAGFRAGRFVHEASIDPAAEGLEARCAALAAAIAAAPEPPPGAAGTATRARAEESALLVAWLSRARPPAAVAVDPAAPEAAGAPLAEAIRALTAPRRRR